MSILIDGAAITAKGTLAAVNGIAGIPTETARLTCFGVSKLAGFVKVGAHYTEHGAAHAAMKSDQATKKIDAKFTKANGAIERWRKAKERSYLAKLAAEEADAKVAARKAMADAEEAAGGADVKVETVKAKPAPVTKVAARADCKFCKKEFAKNSLSRHYKTCVENPVNKKVEAAPSVLNPAPAV